MPTFSTPNPIDLSVSVQVGRLEVVASDRADAVVTVAPTNPEKAVDRRGADETRVDFDGTRLVVAAPKPRIAIFGPTESVDITVELPAGSRMSAEVAVGAVRALGRLGATRVKASTGAVDIEATGDLWLRASHGNASVGAVDGSVDITADHGQIRLGSVTGDAVLKASHGSITVEECGGDLEAKLSYGDLHITRALASVTAKTAYGSIRIGEVSGGAIELDSGFGEVRIGVREGVPAWLDLSSKNGHVRNQLTGDAAPEATEQTVAVRARTQFGDIEIGKAS